MDSSLKPMLCSPVDEVPVDGLWAIEPKLDGWRGIAHVEEGAELGTGDAAQFAAGVHMYGGRNGASYAGKLPYIERALVVALPPDSAVDGEIVGAGWGDVQGVMTRGDGPHIPSKAVPALTYVIFDVLRLAGEDLRALPWSERRERLESLTFAEQGLELSPAGDASQEAHEKFLALGLEGSVCKHKDSPYRNGRSPHWVKIKPQETIDAKIVGFKEGTGSNAGLAGAIKFELPGGVESTCKILDKQLRAAATEEPEMFIGRTIEVKHHGVQTSGKVRHPQFLRFRDDKDQLTEREIQVREAILQTAEPRQTRKAQAHEAIKEPTRRMRNYGAMGDAKLLDSRSSLEMQAGEAYERCIDRGSGNPDADLAVVRQLCEEKGL